MLINVTAIVINFPYERVSDCDILQELYYGDCVPRRDFLID